jgi:dynein light intermediate chain 1
VLFTTLRWLTVKDGASLFYTAPTSPSTYSMLRSHLLHRLYTVPPPLHAPTSATDGELPASAAPPSSLGSTRFPFLHRANVHDRDALMVPAGWDSWGKIKVLRDDFEPTRIDKAWEASLTRRKNDGNQQDEIWIEDLWLEVIPDVAQSGGVRFLRDVVTSLMRFSRRIPPWRGQLPKMIKRSWPSNWISC